MPKNLYRRGSVWWGRVKIAGVLHRRSLRTTARAEARLRLKEWRLQLERAVVIGSVERHNWQEAVVKFAAEVLPGAVRASTANRMLRSLKQVDPILAPLCLDEIDRRTLAQIAARPGVKNATRRRDLSAVSSVLRAAVQWGWIDHNPCADFDRRVIPERREPIRPPTDAEVEAVIAMAGVSNLGRMIQLLASTGMRQEEAAGLEWSQVDLVKGEITLHRTKTSRPRVIKLRALHCGDTAVVTLQGTPRRLGCPYVFWTGKGDRYRNVTGRFGELRRRAGVGFRCHDLRHRYAIEELRAGRDIYDLSRHLGHSSVKTTEIYLAWLSRPVTQSGAQVLGTASG